jgi:hypothetical protein
MIRVAAPLAFVALSGCLGALAYEKRATYTYCQHCGTDHQDHAHHLGPIVLWQWSKTTASPMFRDLLDAGHTHGWTLNCSTFKSIWGMGIG